MMHSVLTYLLAAAMVAVVIVLLTGVAIFVKGGELNRRWSTKMMSLRVATQALVLVALGILLLMRAGN